MIIDFDIARIDEYDVDYIIRTLIAADDFYYNDEESFISDAVYDAARLYAAKVAPHHKYFTGVGSEVRTGKIKLPYQMGSLDQVEIGDITDWVGNWMLQDQFLVVTDKLDGTSAMVIYDDHGDLQIAYSRGNGVEGADITRHIKHLVPANIGGPAVIRGEVIIPKLQFGVAKEIATSRSGSEYKNARNMVAGLMNAKENPTAVYGYIDFVAYEILNYDGIDKVRMLGDLQGSGFKTPFYSSMAGYELEDRYLAKYIDKRRDETDYEIDGIVIEVNLAAKRQQMNPTRDTLNPAYAIKYKVADASNVAETRVVNVEWNVSKHGYLKPRVQVEPVELVGVTVSNATGFNAKFIYDNEVGPGAVVRITRSGDVIPFIQKVLVPAEQWQEPTVPWKWNDTDVDAVLENPHNHDEVTINQMVDFFSSIEAPYLKKGNVEKLYYAILDPLQSIEAVITAKQGIIEAHLGANGTKVYHGLRRVLTDIPLWKLMGSTHFFGRGIGKRKMKKLIDVLGYETVYMGVEDQFADAEGFDEKSASKVAGGMAEFLDWLSPLEEDGYITVQYEEEGAAGDKLAGEKVVFTGFRDKELQALAEANGATMQSSVSGKTTILVAANPNSNSGKMKKARDKGVRIMGIDEFRGLL